MRIPRAWWPPLASLTFYTAITAVLARDVLANLGSAVVNDPGDSLLTSAILYWNAHHVPWSEAWWQLPFFYPTRDALAFSEHLLGVSLMAAPLQWVTGNPVVTYNLVLLATFPLSALSMYALVHRLTGNTPGAFLAGLAYAFAPYRMGHLPHIQMLALFWAPLALVGLHAWVESSRRRWLGLYGAAWALLAMTNGYALMFFSLMVGFWTLWFVVARRNWRALIGIASATIIASAPLAPILYKYATVHAYHAFERTVIEIKFFSADAAAVLCAPATLTFWGWLRIQCGPEGELFSGAVLPLLCVAGLVGLIVRPRGAATRRASSRGPRVVVWLSRALFVLAIAELGAVVGVLLGGPWHLDLGPLRLSASSIDKPGAVGVIALVAAVLLRPGVRAATPHASTAWFYLLSAAIAWMLTLGPNVMFLGMPTDLTGPYQWLMGLPGIGSLRVPARFWMVAVLGLCAGTGILVAHALAGRSRRAIATTLVIAGAGLLADGWVDRIVAAPLPDELPRARDLAGALVLELPAGDLRDLAAEYRAVLGGWKSVNGYSGNNPRYYTAFVDAVRAEDPGLVVPFQELGADLYVAVPDAAKRMHPVVAVQPGVEVWARGGGWTIYKLPRRPTASPGTREGLRLPVARLESSCGPAYLDAPIDGDETTYWSCDSKVPERTLTADLGRVARVGTVVHGLGSYSGAVPWQLSVETSTDGAVWEEAWRGSTFARAIADGIADPTTVRLILSFSPRPARYVRLVNSSTGSVANWVLAELEVWTGR